MELCATAPFKWIVEIAVACLVLGGTLFYFFHDKRQELILSESEIEEALRLWSPKPLGAQDQEPEEPVPKIRYSLAAFDPFVFSRASAAIVDGLPGERPEGYREKTAELKKIIDKYGVGTCGPRGFYGTLDVQLQLEDALAQSLGVAGVVLYSHALLAMASVIKCFCKSHGTVIFYDYRSSVSIRRAIFAARSKSIPYMSLTDLNTKMSLEVGKKFIVTEGVFEETGETADIGGIVKVKKRNNALLILDESISIPMLGSRGCVGFFGIAPSEVDLWVGSLAAGYGAAGGFCGGAKDVAEQQRLSSLAYCFSASLPAFLTYYAFLNLASVIFWETTHEDKGRAVYLSETTEESDSEFTYAPELEYPIRREARSPKFAPRFQREQNRLINTKSVKSLIKVFNYLGRSGGSAVRAKNDCFTPIVRLVVQEEGDNRQLVQSIHRGLVREGILTRTAELPEPSIIFTVDNSISVKAAEELGKQMAQIAVRVCAKEAQAE